MAITKIQLDAATHEDGLPEMETLLDGRERKKIAGRDDWGVRLGRFWSGLSADVEVIELCNGPLSVFILPTRGMGIWKARYNDVQVGWQSPVSRPVHPGFVNVQSRNGLGWLDGFNELICRCGLSFNGPPGHDDGAKSPIESDITLHGRIANLPAGQLELFVDEDEALVGVSGVVEESTLFGPQLRLRSTVTTRIGSNAFTIVDEITNFGPESTELELLYHTNIGQPFLEAGAEFECAADRVVPRDGRAAEGIADYARYLPPTAGYAEQVYFFDLRANDQGETLTLLRNQGGDRGVSLHFQKSQLPCFALWKCTQDERAGYVTGLEPATNFPNFKAFERHHGRVIQLAPGASRQAQLRLEVHSSAPEVGRISEQIRRLQGGEPPKVHAHPAAPYCPID